MSFDKKAYMKKYFRKYRQKPEVKKKRKKESKKNYQRQKAKLLVQRKKEATKKQQLEKQKNFIKYRRKDYVMKLFRERSHEVEKAKKKNAIVVFDEFDFIILKALEREEKPLFVFELSNKIGLAYMNTRNHLARLLYLKLIKAENKAQKKVISITEEGRLFLELIQGIVKGFLIKEEMKRIETRGIRTLMKEFLQNAN